MKTSKLLGEIKEGKVVVLVDNTAAVENIKHFTENMGHTVVIEKRGDDYYLTITKREV
jgi:TusA-related sulfurtransferase